MFDVFYIGENQTVKDHIPFAKQVGNADEVESRTKMFWLIEPNVELIDYDVLEFRPEDHDQKFTHVWKWNSKNYGGLKLIPKKENKGVKEVNTVACKKRFDVLTTKTPGKYFDKHPYATHVWCVDPEYKLNDAIDWAPDNFEPNFIHSFHLRNQLEHKYPQAEGGVKLYPRAWKDADVKYHKFLDAAKSYPVLRVTDVEDYSQRDVYDDEYVWLIDKDHEIEESTLDWVPNPFEQEFIHSFRMPYQLQERYSSMAVEENKYTAYLGGIRLVPKAWRDAFERIHSGVIAHKECPVEDKNYDIFYVDEDEFNTDTYEELAQRSRTEWFWVVDREFAINGKLLYVPTEHEREYIHIFKIPGQLEYRYPTEVNEPWDNRCGGVRLVHKQFDVTKNKYHEGVVPVRYDIFFSDNIRDYETYARKSRTKMFWLIDSEHSISETIGFVPAADEQKYLLNFKINGQLDHKYPEKEGGAQLVPRSISDNTPTKYKGSLFVKNKDYPIVYVDDVTDFSVVKEDCWLIDREYSINHDIDWVPSAFERNNVHTFHVPEQLKHKYPEEMGGVRWVPKNWDGEYVIHKDIPVKPKTYKIYYVEDPNDYTQAKGECWLVDAEYDIDEDIVWVPSNFERNFIHTFHAPGQLEHKYPQDTGGIRWVPNNWQEAEVKIHTESPFRKTYEIVYTDNVEDYSQAKGDCWLVDNEYLIEEDIHWVPNAFERGFIHTFHVPGQLRHKYPEEMGGVRWVPKNWQDAEIKIHSESPFRKSSFETYANEVEGRSKTTKDWFWVVDPNVDVIDEFEFDFVPDTWDAGQTHVWQKLNPITKRQYDYEGVKLCPKEVNTKKRRPKFIREPACIHKAFPTCYLQPGEDIVKQLETFDAECENSMFWVIDPFTQIADDFEFEYYPTQWDSKNVHVFADENDEFRNVRLYPKDTFDDMHSYTDKDIANNSFDNLKQINTVASKRPTWPLVELADVTKDEFVAQLAQHASEGIEFVWSVDPDVEPVEDIIERGFLPDILSSNKIHVWQRANPRTGLQHSYGGLRLWPTKRDYSEMTTSALELNRFKGLQYVKQLGCKYKPYEVVFLSYHEPDAEQSITALREKVDAHWVKDVDGIFEAHKAGASKVSSKMFWVVDADAEITEDFDFSYIPDVYDQEVVHVWNSKNPITGHEYGYGGVKLFNTQQVLDATSWGLDFTTGLSSRFKAMPDVSNITKFNTDEFSTWRSAFREAVKLTINGDEESDLRLQGWLYPMPGADFREQAKAGAAAGVEYANANASKPMKLAKINDYEWLQEQYNNAK